MSATIVVGYIPSPEGIAAFERAKEEASLRGMSLVVVNSGHHGDFSSRGYASGQDLDAIDHELSEAAIAHEILQPASDRAPAVEILDAAASHGAELIVIGLRRRSPVGKLLMGSTAQHVLLDASCDVLAVKPPAG